MNLQYRVLLLVVISVLLGATNLKAETPGDTKQPTVQGKPEASGDETLDAITICSDCEGIENDELLYFDTELTKKGFYSPFNQFQSLKDSITSFGIPLYLQLMNPVVQKIKNEKIEMIEIL